MRNKMVRWTRELVIFLLLAGAVSLAVDYLRRPALPQDFSSEPLETIDGQPVDLAAMSQDRPLLIYVWATWCSVCRFTTPSVASLAASGANVVTVALRSGDDAALAQGLRRRHLAAPAVNDARGQLAARWGVQATPTILIVYRGKITSVTTGWTSGWGMRLRLWMA
ncbi:protein disulfide oxidoreductase [Pluralibacter gergoviae]